MNLDPKTFEKKDHIFMDLFTMYGKNFIDESKTKKKTGYKSVQNPKKAGKKILDDESSGFQTPMDNFYQDVLKSTEKPKAHKNAAERIPEQFYLALAEASKKK